MTPDLATLQEEIKELDRQADRMIGAGSIFSMFAFVALFKLADPAYAYGLALAVFWIIGMKTMGLIHSCVCKLEHLQEMGVRRESERKP